MLVSLEHQFAFFSNPKCATTSIEEYISKHCEISITSTKLGKHTTPRNFKKLESFLKTECNTPFLKKICTARDPVKKIISWYTYRSRPRLKSKRPERYLGATDFRSFCRSQMQRCPLSFFYENATNDFFVDFVVPVDHLSRLETFFQNKFNLKDRFSQKNTSSAETPQLNTSQLHEIALSELNNASLEFHKGIEIYTTILEYYNKANHERIIRINKIF